MSKNSAKQRAQQLQEWLITRKNWGKVFRRNTKVTTYSDVK